MPWRHCPWAVFILYFHWNPIDHVISHCLIYCPSVTDNLQSQWLSSDLWIKMSRQLSKLSSNEIIRSWIKHRLSSTAIYSKTWNLTLRDVLVKDGGNYPPISHTKLKGVVHLKKKKLLLIIYSPPCHPRCPCLSFFSRKRN